MSFKRTQIRKGRFCGLVGGIASGLIIGTLVVMLAPIFIDNEYIDRSWMWIIAMTIHTVMSFASVALIEQRAFKEEMLIAVMVISGWLIMNAVLGLVIFEGALDHVLSAVVGCLIGASAAVLMRKKMQNQRKRSKQKGRR